MDSPAAAPLVPESADLQGPRPGTVLLGKYELVRQLCEGGMGVVWIARDCVLNVDVAVKLIQRPDSEWPKFAERALNEARLAASIAHPAVCRAVDFGFAPQVGPFVVSELLVGENLEELLTHEGRLPAIRAVRTLLPILDALELAHDKGIVHRDVKPANLFLARVSPERLQPKLLDFGIARWSEDKKHTTITGAVMGTPDYMSPEQARGSRDIDSRSDLWSFCATLYEAVTGAPPFEGDNPNAVLWSIQSTDPVPITQRGVADPWLSAIICRGLQRSPEARWQTAGDLACELTRWLLANAVETDVCGQALGMRLVDPRQQPIAPADLPPPASDRTRFRIGVRASWVVAAFAAGALLMVGWKLSRGSASLDAKRAATPVLERSPARALTSIAGAARTSAAAEATAATVEQPDPPRVIPREPSAPVRRAPARAAVEHAEPVVAAPAAPTAPEDERPATPPEPAVPRPAPSKPRATNALGYDFGL